MNDKSAIGIPLPATCKHWKNAWVAADERGDVYAYEIEPRPDNEQWCIARGGIVELYRACMIGIDWRDTKRKVR